MPQSLTALPQSSLSLSPAAREELHVHAVYDQIASHFSQTRYKPWPIISAFLSSLPAGSVGLDSGTGNGKYLPLDQGGTIFTIGLDRSRNLLEIAKNAGIGGTVREVVWGDVLDNGWRPGSFDYAISIATIHHLSTAERRQRGIQTLMRSVNPKHGRLMIYVWAVDQDPLSKRVLPGSSRSEEAMKISTDSNQTKAPKVQDVLVPWVQQRSTPKDSPKQSQASQSDVNAGASTGTSAKAREPEVFQRYYHFFEEGELRELARTAAEGLGLLIGNPLKPGVEGLAGRRGVHMVDEGYERSNYYLEMRMWSV